MIQTSNTERSWSFTFPRKNETTQPSRPLLRTWFPFHWQFAFVLIMSVPTPSASDQDFRIVTFKTEDGGTIEGSWFEAEDKRAAIFAHGAVFNKESWYPLARRLQKAGVGSLSIDFRGYGNSKGGNTNEKYQDILGAVAYLEGQGYSDITIIGGSMGGSAVLRALSHSQNPNIKRVIILAASGPPIRNSALKKLFIVSQGDGISPSVRALYEASNEPKELRVLPGKAHAQHIFATEHGGKLTELILETLKN